MPIVAVVGAAIGVEVLGPILGGGIIGSAIGGAIGGGIGGGLGSVAMGGNFGDGFKSGALGGALGGAVNSWLGPSVSGATSSQAGMLADQYAGFSAADTAAHLAGSGASTNLVQAALEGGGLNSFAASDIANASMQNYMPSTDIASGLENLPEATTQLASPAVTTDTFGGLKGIFDKTGGALKDILPKNMDQMQLGMAGIQTLQDYANAKKLQDLANQAAIPYNQYMDTFNNPGKYWDEYISGVGGEQYNKAARDFANAGRTGMLPTLYTLGYQNYMANYLPQARQGLATASNMASANMQQQAYPMQMQTRALSYIPQVYTTNKLLDIYRRKQ